MPLSAKAAAWETARRTYYELAEKLDGAALDQVDVIESAMAEQQDILMLMPAPDLIAIQSKLLWLWEADLGLPTRDSAEKDLILEDIHDHIGAVATLLGMKPVKTTEG